jgi:DNA repair exonuclease SbcCD ATPase subunit
LTLRILALTAKNFLSIGNCTQSVNLDQDDLTLVLGENIDLGGEDAGGHRNGVGKTTIITALSYALYGQSISDISKDNLINKTNSKGMLVTVDFEQNGTKYRIERGRKPGILELYIGDQAFKSKDNDAQGDSRETQQEIDKIIGMSHTMFTHIVAMNTYTEPFLKLKTSDQREVIEQLLGITTLSEKAEKLKEKVKASKDTITNEEYRINATIEANKKIEEQIVLLQRRQTTWDDKFLTDVTALQTSIDELLTIDINTELKNHKLLAEYELKQKDLTDLELALSRGQKDLDREDKAVAKLIPEIENLINHKCHSCGQELHNATQETLLATKTKDLADHQAKSKELTQYIAQIKEAIADMGVLGTKPSTSYKKVEEASHHKATIDQLNKQLSEKIEMVNPYTEQISEMQSTALAVIDYTVMNDVTKLKEHQEFLLKLLTNKDSYIRKRIIDQNLTYLNSRLSHYLDKIGMPHTVVFQNDLTVQIEELGRELNFGNLSRGESTRVILSLSLAFRDVYESLYFPINLLMIDELADVGLDSSGAESALSILKRLSRDTNKSIWLISHREEFSSRVNRIFKVIKENGFTEWKTPEIE